MLIGAALRFNKIAFISSNPGDIYWGQTALDLTFNNTYTDSSALRQTVTANGSLSFSSAQARYGTYSLYNATTTSSTNYVSVPLNATNNPTQGDWCLEGWFYLTAYQNPSAIVTWGNDSVGNAMALLLVSGSSVQFAMSSLNYGSFPINITNRSCGLNVWHYFTFERSGSYIFCTLDGNTIGSSSVGTGAYTGTMISNYIGASSPGGYKCFLGYTQNIRFTAGTSRYGDPSASIVTNAPSFTPPTAVFPTSYPADPFWNNQTAGKVQLLIQGGSATDTSPNAATVTNNNSVTFVTPSIACPTSQSTVANFNGTNQYLSLAASTNWVMTGDFTIEAYIFITATGTFRTIIDQEIASTTGQGYWNLQVISTNAVSFYYDGTPSINTNVLGLNAWHHIVATRSGSTIYLSADGILCSTATFSGTVGCNQPLWIGASQQTGPAYYFPGYIAGIRITKGIGFARYPGTVGSISALLPTTVAADNLQPLVALHPLYSVDLSDSSSNALTPTAFGSAAVAVPGTLPPNGAAKALSLNGSTDYVTYANSSVLDLAANDFSIEVNIYITSISGNPCILAKRATVVAQSFILDITSSQLQFLAGNGTTYFVNIIQSGTISTGVWHNVVVIRAGTVWTLFLDGVSVGTQTVSGTVSSNTAPLIIGNATSAPTAGTYFNGYISDLRITNGAARYPALPVPSAAFPTKWVDPYWKYVGGLYLLNNSGSDASTHANTAATVGSNFAYSTAQSKYQTYSALLGSSTAGTNSAITFPNNSYLTLGVSDYTLEFWFYPTNLTGQMVCAWGGSTSFPAFLLIASASATTGIYLGNAAASAYAASTTTGAAMPTGNWYHIAYCRIGGTVFAYINGILQVSGAVSGTFTNTTGNNLGAAFGVYGAAQGYFSGVRVTQGVGRYPTNFTPPLLAFPTTSS